MYRTYRGLKFRYSQWIMVSALTTTSKRDTQDRCKFVLSPWMLCRRVGWSQRTSTGKEKVASPCSSAGDMVHISHLNKPLPWPSQRDSHLGASLMRHLASCRSQSAWGLCDTARHSVSRERYAEPHQWDPPSLVRNASKTWLNCSKWS